MTQKQQNTAKIIREFYLYPYRSKEENAIRGGAWITSWIIGIVAQQTTNPQAKGGAYFIFSLSLLLEFVPESRTCFWARFIHGIFRGLLFIMFIGSLILIFGGISNKNQAFYSIYLFLTEILPYVGWIIFVTLFLCIGLVFFEARKDNPINNPSVQNEVESKQEATRQIFMDNLDGNMKGENT